VAEPSLSQCVPDFCMERREGERKGKERKGKHKELEWKCVRVREPGDFLGNQNISQAVLPVQLDSRLRCGQGTGGEMAWNE
jgi:hypothetical protein